MQQNQPLNSNVNIRDLGVRDYQRVWHEMRTFTEARDANTKDEFWLLEHHPVFTLGLNGKPEHVLKAGTIPVIKCDRGGQVTYHGPGQLVVYTLLDLKRLKFGIKQLVTQMEQAVIDILSMQQINAVRKPNAPGVYVNNAKIAALGLRVKHGCTYHGLSLNVNMDLEPFYRINPCGFKNLTSVQLNDLLDTKNNAINLNQVKQDLILQLERRIFNLS
ncbi:MAG: lipoyl(octanoyl) transferase LipB [Gammaproteobacteria bacterium]|nr:lipoyl(octanoyl) transferase LipB [Gammaproteobacteria bacterium]